MVDLIEWAARIVPWLLLGFGVIAIVAVPLYLWRARRTSLSQAAAWTGQDVAVVASLVTILAFTGRPGIPSGGEATINLQPFSDLFHAFDLSRFYVGIAAGNLIGNVLLFVPLGLALAMRFRGLGVLGAGAVFAGLSLAVEAYQAVSGMGRNADVTDVLMNTLGGAIGYVVMRGFGPALRGVVGTGRTPDPAS